MRALIGKEIPYRLEMGVRVDALLKSFSKNAIDIAWHLVLRDALENPPRFHSIREPKSPDRLLRQLVELRSRGLRASSWVQHCR